MKLLKQLYSPKSLSRRGSSTMEYIIIIAAAVILAGIIYVYISSDGGINTTVQNKVEQALDGKATVSEGTQGPGGSNGSPNGSSPNSGTDGKSGDDWGKLPGYLDPKLKDRLPTLIPGLDLSKQLEKIGELVGGIKEGCAAAEGDCPNGAVKTIKDQKDPANERTYTPTPERPYGKLEDVKITDKQYAIFSQFAYDDFEPGPNTPIDPKFLEKHLGKGWEEDIEHRYTDKNGFQAKVFINKETKEAVVAFRGTDDWKDIAIDVAQVSQGWLTSQHKSVDKMMETLMKDPRYKDYQFTSTGHSLGGNLSMYAGVKYNMPTVTFNGPGYDTPKMKDAVYSDKYHDLIRNYNFGKDPIGANNNKPGLTYNVKIGKDYSRTVEQQDHVKWINYRPLKGLFSWGDHGIGNFTGITGSDPQTDAKKIADENQKRRNNSIIGDLPGQYDRDYEKALKKKQKEYEDSQKRVDSIFGPDGNIQGR
ncbi:Mbeg1-like protein [Hazenella coriacea]|uniref:DUF2974 family protein n=1 Tax=Hazenella coriacea TaxID=1179467 RepID=A0A4R3LBS0_9BACL|nr:Mbeg1-like protein [Hazenella coriacea]TCS95754.1 DUF2974 family protein [Hazenella coriacea]